MEVLAGARSEAELRDLSAMLSRTRVVQCTPADYLEAASVYRACRAAGETVRRLVDCLIASVAIREGIAVLHADRDFEVIARHSKLALVE